MFKTFSLAALAAVSAVSAGSLDVSFEEFLTLHGKSYPDMKEYELRRTLFEQRRAAFAKHNAEGHSYKLGLNQFADLSSAEIKQMKGFNKAQHFSMRNGTRSHGDEFRAAGRALPNSLDWRDKKALTSVKNQGGCGSCWAFGSAETLESHTFLHGSGDLPVLAPQQYVDCAPNPNHCGGTGGCEGSIPELAYTWSEKNGLAAEADYPYTGMDGTCKITKSAAKVTGFVNVASNNYTAVMEALQVGPLAITVAAGPWEFYDSGIFTQCPTGQDSEGSIDLDHVVQLVGYGSESNTDYWIVRNSWGAEWGESGYIRIERHADGNFCGTDNKPADGTGCNGGPSSVTVCGSCGILYDAVYPKVN